MWIFFLYSLAFAHGALAEIDCSKEDFKNCTIPTLFYSVPTDVLEYNRLCPQLSAYLRCLKEFHDQCGYPIFFDSEEVYDGMHGAFSDVCEEGTFLYRVTIENLRCFNETFRTTSCPEKVKAVTGPYRTYHRNAENETGYSLQVEIMCLQNILESNCIAADLGKNCGKDALDAAVEFIRRFHYIDNICKEQDAKILLKDLDVYNLDQEQKAVVIAILENIIISAKE